MKAKRVRRWRRVGLVIGLGSMAIIVSFRGVFGLRINLTPSMPIGFYLADHHASVKRGDWVAVCLPEKIAQEGLTRHYLFYDFFDRCPHHSMPVLKQLIALPGDHIAVLNNELCANHHCYFAPIKTIDSHQHKIHLFIQKGIYSSIQTFWLYGAEDEERSWDSRYWGGVDRTAMIGVYRPLWVMDSSGDHASPTPSTRNSSLQKIKAHRYAPAPSSSPILGQPKIS